MMPPSKVLPHGAPYSPFLVLTVFLKSLVRSLAHDSSVRGWSVVSGCRACRSEPELYRKTSFMSPVERRVLTRLSPSVPPGRGSTLTVMDGLALWKPAARSLANFVAAGSLPPARSEIVVAPDDPPDKLQPASAAPASARAPSTATTLPGFVVMCIEYLLVSTVGAFIAQSIKSI